jgi:uncharacterized protein (DUF3084 family)
VELDAKDAATRGQLHDLSRLQEQLAQRERELEAQIVKLAADQEAYVEREAQLVRRADELSRREHVVAQRWSRLQTASCPDCGRRISPNQVGTGDTPPNAPPLPGQHDT